MTAAWRLLVSCWFLIPTCSAAITPGHGHHQLTGFLESNSTHADAPPAVPDCIPHTGGTCVVNECHAWRGATECSWGRCHCQPGYCAGADGKCHNKRYATVLPTFRLRNMRWPDMFVTVSHWNTGVLVGADSFSQASAFSLRQTPDGAYLISPHAYPDYAVAIERSETCTENDCDETWSPKQKGIKYGFDVQELASKFQSAPDVPNAVMISSLDHPDRYWYVGRYSWNIGAYHGDPGTGGYWYPDPPLPFTPPAFTGRRCSYGCSASLQVSPSYLLAVLIGLQVIGLHIYK